MILDHLSKQYLRDRAGGRTYLRGKEYFDDTGKPVYYAAGRILRLEVTENQLRAKVKGTSVYNVEITLRNGSLEFSCNCPVGLDGVFCKHCVAAGLGGLAFDRRKVAKSLTPELKPWVELDIEGDIEDAASRSLIAPFLKSRTEKQAMDLLIRIDSVEQVHKRMRELAHIETRDNAKAGKILNKLDNAIVLPEYSRRGRPPTEYSDDVYLLLDQLRKVLTPLNAPQVANRCWKLALSAYEVLDQADDSFGEFSRVCQNLLEIHLSACRLFLPHAKNLAARIYRAMRDDEHGIWSDCIPDYQDLLGEEGLDHIRTLAEQQLQSVIPEDEDMIATLQEIIACVE